MEGRGISLLTLLLVSAIVLTFAALNVRSYVFAGSPPPVRSTVDPTLEKPLLHLYAAIDVDSFLGRRSRGNWSGSPHKVVRLAGRSAMR